MVHTACLFVCVFSADQTPTPTTRLIRNCEEFGLFDDLKHVNPFEETFRLAIDGKSKLSPSILLTTQKSLELIKCNDEETLHTPIPLKYTTAGNADKEKKPPNDASSADKSSDAHSIQPIKPVTVVAPPVVRKKVNWPKAVDNSSDKPLDTSAKKPFRKIHPKPVIVSTISNPIKDKIRQSLLKCQTMHGGKNMIIGHVATVNMDVPKAEHKPKTVKSKTSSNSRDGHANERNREAAKRYRNKQKHLHDKLLMRNAQLEAEVVRLRHQLDAFKKAHEKCSVTQMSGTMEFK